MPTWNEGGFGDGQYDAGTITDGTPPPLPILPPPIGPSAGTTAKAIKNYWDSSSLPPLTSDGLLWYGEAPNQPVTPYAVLIQVSEPEKARTTAFALFEGTYQINCMHDRLQDAEAMASAVWSEFNGAHLVRDGNTVLHCLSGEQRSTLGHESGINGEDCWISYVEIEVLYTRS